MDEKQLFIENEKLIYFVIYKMHLDKYPEDLYDLGLIGLTKAIKSFNPEKYTFSTYATTVIHNEIYNYLRNKNINFQNNMVSLDIELKGRDNLLLKDVIKDNINIEEDIIKKYQIDTLYKSIGKLTNIEKFVICHTYTLCGCKYLTQLEMTKILNKNQTYISRIKKRAIKKLKKFMEE